MLVLVKRMCSIGLLSKCFRRMRSCSSSVNRSILMNFKQPFRFLLQCLIPFLISILVSRPVHGRNREKKARELKIAFLNILSLFFFSLIAKSVSNTTVSGLKSFFFFHKYRKADLLYSPIIFFFFALIFFLFSSILPFFQY